MGLAYCLLILLIWLLGTNYQNNLILALAYWQMGLFVVVILATYHNLAGLKIRFVGARPGFVGEPIQFMVAVSTTNRQGCDRLRLGWQHSPSQLVTVASESSGLLGTANLGLSEGPEILYLSASPVRRGVFRPGRLLLESIYPMGLLRCWSWLPLEAQALVYPAPLACALPAEGSGGDASEGEKWVSGGEEFAGLQTYQEGHSPKRIAWKQYAREQGLFSKNYTQVANEQLWLAFDQFHRGDTELTLSNLCYWVLQLHSLQRPYGLRLPGLEIAIGSGEDHQLAALQALASFGGDSPWQ